jgi:phage terminase small subunit
MYPNETNQRIINYMEIIVEALEEQYNGDVPSKLIIQLDLLHDLWKQYFKCTNELAKNDLFTTAKDTNRTYMNPAIQLQQQLYQKIMDSCKNLGITLFEEKKVKLINKKLKVNAGKSSENIGDTDEAKNMAKMLLS